MWHKILLTSLPKNLLVSSWQQNYRLLARLQTSIRQPNHRVIYCCWLLKNNKFTLNTVVQREIININADIETFVTRGNPNNKTTRAHRDRTVTVAADDIWHNRITAREKHAMKSVICRFAFYHIRVIKHIRSAITWHKTPDCTMQTYCCIERHPYNLLHYYLNKHSHRISTTSGSTIEDVWDASS